MDWEVNKSSLDFMSDLTNDDKGISDLTGISKFDALVNLNIRNNEISTLNVTYNSNLLFVWAEGYDLEIVNVAGLSFLEKLGLDRSNPRSIDIGTNSGI